MSRAPRPLSPAAARGYVIAAAVLWSTSGLFLKTLSAPGHSVHWLAIAGVRSAFGMFVFLPGLAQPRPSARKLAAAVFLYVLLVSTLMGSMQLGTAAQGIWLQYIAPVVVALWVWLVQRQRLQAAEIAAVVLTLVALACIVTGGSGPAHRQSVLLGVISGFGFGFFILVLKSLTDVPPQTIFVWTNLGTAALLLPVLFVLHIPLPHTARDLTLLAVMGTCQLCLPYCLFQRGLAGVAPLAASLIALLEPVLNPIWVYLAVGEQPSARVIAGCALIALGLVAYAVGRKE